MDFRNIEIGPLTVHAYGLIIALAILIGWYLAKRRAKVYRIPLKFFDDPILLIPPILAIAGARLYHVIDYWQIYRQNPVSITYIGNGGLGIWGAILGGIVGFYFVCRLKKLDFLRILDLFAPSMILGQAVGRLGNYINQEGFGPPTSLPWGVFIDKQNRPLEYIDSSYFHPTFFYEAILNLIFFALLLKFSDKLKGRGQIFALYLILYSVGRFTVEFYRIDTAVLGAFKVAQLLSIVTFILGLYLLTRFKKLNNG